MTTVKNSKARQRIIEAASKLFYQHDAHTIGVDRISEEANVSKRTLYKYFSTKEELLSTVITVLGTGWFEACKDSESDDPADRIRHVFKMMEPVAELEDFKGCVLMNTSIELRDSNALARGVARDFKQRLFEYFEHQAKRMEVKNPSELAQQLVMLFDGCSAWIVMRHKFPASTHSSLKMLLS
jgi:AcrR family transcriptional regulator